MLLRPVYHNKNLTDSTLMHEHILKGQKEHHKMVIVSKVIHLISISSNKNQKLAV
jgi:hypothetical protein